jgi:ubiquinone/menaquinone biosynthesis C-methylase UbiE
MSMPTPPPAVPNHHADHPGFSGIVGALAGASMLARGSVARLAADLTGVGPDDHVVDVGCGPGPAAREAARRGATVTAVDPASVMLALARRTTRSGVDVTWLEGTAEALPVADGVASVLWSLATVHHWRDVEAGLAEAARVLAPGGRLLVVERRTRPGARGLASHGWTRPQAEAFADLSRSAGFPDAAVETHRTGRFGHQLVVRATRPGGPPGPPAIA